MIKFMIIIRFCGGLGNQMFQYAMYLSLKQKYPNNVVKAEIFHYNIENEHNGFELTKVFNLDIDYATKKELRKVFNGIIFDEKYSCFPPIIKSFLLKSFQNRYLSLANRVFVQKSKMLIFDDPENRFVKKINQLENGNWYLRGFWQRTDYFEKIRNCILKSFNLTCKLSKNDLDSCHCFLIGTRSDGIALTKYVGYETKSKLYNVGKTMSLEDKKILLSYGRVSQHAKQQSIQPQEKRKTAEESIKDEIGDEFKHKTQENRQNEQEAETKWMNSLQACYEQVGKMHDGAKMKQEVVKLIQDLEQERRQEKNAEIQEENQNNEQR